METTTGHLAPNRFDRRGELRATLKRIGALACLDLGERVGDLVALGLGKTADGLALRLEPKPGCPLFLRAHAEVCDDGMHVTPRHGTGQVRPVTKAPK